MQPGMNDIYVKMSYQSGQFLFNYTRVFAINAGFGLDFQPSLELVSPAPGSITHVLSPTVTGTCDDNATSVSLSKDNITFVNAQKQGSSWSGLIQLAPGQNVVHAKATYVRGDFSYSYSRTFTVSTGFGLDFQPNLILVSSSQGSIVHVMNPTLTGMCDDNASSIALSTTNITYVEAMKQGTTWSESIHLTSGQNTVYAMATYVRGDFSYSYFKQFTVTTGFGLDFTPNIGLVSPKAASTINDLTPQLTGICDENASWIVYSQDNFTFFSTLKQGPNWRSETPAQLSSGQNTIYVKATYQRGDFWYNYTKAFSLSVDTTWIYQKNGSTNLGIGTIGIIITVIAIAGVGGFILFRRSGRKKP